ncbi:hypothetical protein VTL71DRAFT_2349 [Oculimacula yallundae]|uniref:Uncharacterized protein n=1 Tax=Oculimacula yallundae TaxID=86028 RepID=A0ABR4CAW1_9HELO
MNQHLAEAKSLCGRGTVFGPKLAEQYRCSPQEVHSSSALVYLLYCSKTGSITIWYRVSIIASILRILHSIISRR